MSDNPFSEPADNDRTVIRPTPGGRRSSPAARTPPSPAPPSTAPAAKPAPLPAVDPSAPPAVSFSPLAVAASPLLELLNRLRAMRRPPDPRALHERAVKGPARLRAARPRHWHRHGGAAAGALRTLCQYRRSGVEHALGCRQRLGEPDPGGDLPSWRARDRPVLRTAQSDAAGASQIPARHRTDVPLHFARLHGSLSAGAWRGRAWSASAPRLTPRSWLSTMRPIRSCRTTGAASRRRIGRVALACRSGSLLPARRHCAGDCCSGHPPA